MEFMTNHHRHCNLDGTGVLLSHYVPYYLSRCPTIPPCERLELCLFVAGSNLLRLDVILVIIFFIKINAGSNDHVADRRTALLW